MGISAYTASAALLAEALLALVDVVDDVELVEVVPVRPALEAAVCGLRPAAVEVGIKAPRPRPSPRLGAGFFVVAIDSPRPGATERCQRVELVSCFAVAEGTW